MKSLYHFKYSRKVMLLGALQIIVAIIAGCLIYITYEGDYLAVWFTSFVVALLLLFMLSIPRSIRLTPTTVEVRCIMEIRVIKIANITSLRRVNPHILKWCIPLVGGYNLFGYYGTYFDLRRAERVQMYATEWRHFVEIIDIYDDRYYISCCEGEALIKEIERLRSEL